VQKVAERLVRQFLKVHHAVACEQVEGLPGRVVELNPLARHHFARVIGRNYTSKS
jgi:hypothetical protein